MKYLLALIIVATPVLAQETDKTEAALITSIVPGSGYAAYDRPIEGLIMMSLQAVVMNWMANSIHHNNGQEILNASLILGMLKVSDIGLTLKMSNHSQPQIGIQIPLK